MGRRDRSARSSSTATGVEPTPPPPPDEPVSEEFTITAGNPSGDTTQGVTGTEFANSCAFPPASQGADGWVTKLPDGFDDGAHTVSVAGESAVPYDIDVYFYNSRCELMGSVASSAANESGAIPSGATYILSRLYLGEQVPVKLTMRDTA